MFTNEEITECQHCGTCCRKGGPALHREDINILLDGHISHDRLVTVRKGEPAYSPVSDSIEPTDRELVKINGQDSNWVCTFLEQTDNSCRIYDHRPLECRLQQCWDNEALLEIIGKDTISRFDIINQDDPISDIIKLHDQECACDILQSLPGSASDDLEPETMSELTKLVRKDLNLRAHVATKFNLPVAVELFLFGRPLFIILNSLGIEFNELEGDVHLRVRE